MTPIALDGTNLTVNIYDRPADAFAPAGITVDVIYTGDPHVDRPQVYSWGMKREHRALAARLKAAVLAGRVLRPHVIARDVNGRTYLASTQPPAIAGRRMNADLQRLGF